MWKERKNISVLRNTMKAKNMLSWPSKQSG